MLSKKDLKRLKDIPNCEIVSYNPPGITLNLGINYRDHRKILLIDGAVCFVGGINIADEYIHKKERFGFAAAFLLVFAAVIYVAVCWTPVTYTSLYGVQGKYLLPAFPLLLLACKNKVVTIKKDIFNHICFVMSVTNIFVVLNALTIILQR